MFIGITITITEYSNARSGTCLFFFRHYSHRRKMKAKLFIWLFNNVPQLLTTTYRRDFILVILDFITHINDEMSFYQDFLLLYLSYYARKKAQLFIDFWNLLKFVFVAYIFYVGRKRINFCSIFFNLHNYFTLIRSYTAVSE